ncbi:MAG: hypothetical protein ACKPJ9_08775 [Dolichospermum sp.]
MLVVKRELPITHYPLPITHYPLPITHYQSFKIVSEIYLKP